MKIDPKDYEKQLLKGPNETVNQSLIMSETAGGGKSFNFPIGVFISKSSESPSVNRTLSTVS